MNKTTELLQELNTMQNEHIKILNDRIKTFEERIEVLKHTIEINNKTIEIQRHDNNLLLQYANNKSNE